MKLKTGWLTLAILTVVCGCGERKLVLHPVRGQIRYQGKPVDRATVLFRPKTPAEGKTASSPSGETDAEGKFILTTYRRGDGAPAGEYYVGVIWPSYAKGESPERGEMPSGPDRLPAADSITAVLPAPGSPHNRNGIRAATHTPTACRTASAIPKNPALR